MLSVNPTSSLTVEAASDRRLAFVEGLIREQAIVKSDKQRSVSPSGKDQAWLMDLRTILLNGRALSYIAQLFWDRFEDEMPFQVGGLELASIPLIAAIAIEGENRNCSINTFFLRKERKGDGLGRLVEGTITRDPIIAVDDLTHGATSLEKIRVVAADHGHRLSRAFVIVDFNSRRSIEWREKHDIQVDSLFNLERFGLSLRPAPSYRPTHRFEPLWSTTAQGANPFIVAPGSSPISDGKAVYVGTDGGALRAIDVLTGQDVWTFEVEKAGPKGIRSSPALVEGKVLFGAYNGVLYCLESSTGQEVWHTQAADWIGSSPVVSLQHRLVIIGLEHALPGAQGGVAAFNLGTGEKIWEHPAVDYVHCSPVLSADEDRVFIGTNANDLVCLDTRTGALVWQYWTKGAIKAHPAVCNDLGVVVVASFDRCIHLVETATGKPRAVIATGDRLFTTPLIVGDVAYVGSSDKSLYLIDLLDGSVLKSFALGARVYATPVLIGGIVYVGTTAGTLFGIDPVTLTSQPVLQLPDRITNAPLLVREHGILVVPLLGSRLFAFRAEGIVDTSRSGTLAHRGISRLKAPPLSGASIATARGDGQYFRIDELVGRPVLRPYAAMPSRRLLGATLLLTMHADGYKDLSQDEWKARMIPALLANQVRIFLYGIQPVGMVTWAMVSPEVEAELVEDGRLPAPDAWQSGDHVWIIDVIAPFGGSKLMLDKVRRETLRGRTVRHLRARTESGADGGFDLATLTP